MKHLAATLLLAAWVIPGDLLPAQRPSAGAGVGVGTETWRADVHGQLDYPIGTRLRVGGGLRLTRYGGTGREFEGQGPSATDLPASLVLDPEVWGLNLMLAVEVRVVGPIHAGANLDVLGIAGGPARPQGSIEVSPARFSMFRYGNADRGSLNSEFFLAVRINPQLSIRAGLSHYVTGYEAELAGDARRYLRFDDAVFVAVRWRPGSP